MADLLHAAHGHATIAGVRQQYPPNVAVDFTQLRPNALRRYLAYHKLQEIPGSSKEQLAAMVARHFNDECKRADEQSSISSFVTYLTGTKDLADKSAVLPAASFASILVKRKAYDDDDKENFAQPTNRYDDEDQDEMDEEFEEVEDDDYDVHAEVPQKPSPIDDESYEPQDYEDEEDAYQHHSASGGGAKKKKRKARVYCVCKGSSFGNMIACDNRKCLDRSNWYHMRCVGLDASRDPPETWFCPSCQEKDLSEIPENQYRKPVASVTYGDMISHALTTLPGGKGTFKEICDFVEHQYESQLNWKLESDQRKSPVWKSSVRKILFSNIRFRKHPDDKGLFCLAA